MVQTVNARTQTSVQTEDLNNRNKIRFKYQEVKTMAFAIQKMKITDIKEMFDFVKSGQISDYFPIILVYIMLSITFITYTMIIVT